jgi:transcriptional regulator with XRE-family HTH domain
VANEQVERSVEDNIGRNVRRLRERQGWTQADLARRLERFGVRLHHTAIAKIEADRPRAIRAREVYALASAFGVPVGELFSSVEENLATVINHLSHAVASTETIQISLTRAATILRDMEWPDEATFRTKLNWVAAHRFVRALRRHYALAAVAEVNRKIDEVGRLLGIRPGDDVTDLPK